ncbi:universal stress protein [Streptomyces sp. TRM43335]|uniref:Universal stress protein n=1 Tax=Streptomyces taklimakanensis TaxID=2569853 RepID=A0A6G2B6R6_9ACTN|nr:universal stress protein [Streptomyces taklimakanensis]MTE17958.1 universal stress protein [Streptomyces taklimakanensis]
MVRTVTVGVDGSAESLAAADWAAREALSRKAPLRLVHVREPDPFGPPDSVADEETRRHWAQRIPRGVADGLTGRYPELEITTDQLTGRPAEVLVSAAEQAGVLVVGSRGLGPIAGFLVGSVGLATVARVACPVVLVRAGAAGGDEGKDTGADGDGGGDGGGGEATRREVVLGLELYRECDEVIEFAFDAAARRGAPLKVVHGWNPPLVYGIDPVAVDPRMAGELAEESARVLGDTLRGWREKYPNVEVRARAVAGRPSRLLTEASEGAALLVVGRRGRRSPLGFHIGPVAHAVMHHAASPVAVVPFD